jgi:hypothetical protein
VYFENEKIFDHPFEKSKNGGEDVQSESDGLSVAKVLNAISEDRSWSLFTTIAISDLNGQQFEDGGQILISRMNLTRKHANSISTVLIV